MKLKFFNAQNGDAIHLMTNSKMNIVLDMGYPETYYSYIKKSINDIKDENINIDLLIISHIDQDHIGGAISFLKDICESVFDKEIIKEIWHNSYRHLNLSQVENICSHDYVVLETLKEGLESEFRKESSLPGNKEISAIQGSTLAGMIYRLGILWNEVFDNGPVFGIQKIKFRDMNITILTPTLAILERLKRFWRSELISRKIDFKFGTERLFDDAYEFYLLNEAVFEDDINKISDNSSSKFHDLLESGVSIEGAIDKSITNASSISLIIEEDGRRVLLTSDANDNDLFEALNSFKKQGDSMEFDLIKLSHHGSLKNNSRWLSLVNANYYVISTDSSKHNHPDIETIVNVILSNKGHHKTICFNNIIDTAGKIDNPELMKKYNYSILLPNQDWGIEIDL